jgi:hypothetical protein
MSEIHAVILLRHGPLRATEGYVDALPDWVVDQWAVGSHRPTAVPASLPQKRQMLLWRLVLVPEKHESQIHRLLVEYYSEHQG